ncbi:hypothetical protein DMUE_2972 [Dictyocoela muelleri]|nr:hypothetical protein DMUE_2972 [Dictyocoela muelleri]
MNFEKEPKNSRSPIFQNNKNAIQFIEQLGLLNSFKICSECRSIMVKEHDISYSSDYRLRCSNEKCGKSKPIFSGLKISCPRIDISEYLFIIYSWLENDFQYNIDKNTTTSLSSLKRIKRLLLERVTFDNEKEFKKLGLENHIQVDESVILKGKMIKSPSKMYD